MKNDAQKAKFPIMYAYHDVDEAIDCFCKAFGFELKSKVEFAFSPMVHCKLKNDECEIDVAFKIMQTSNEDDLLAKQINCEDELAFA